MGGRGTTELRRNTPGLRRIGPADTAGQRIVRRSFGIAALGVLALVCASCAGGPQHLGAKSVRDGAVSHVKTDPVTSTSAPSTTTTTAPAPKTDPSTFTPPPAPAPAPVATTTTTNPLPPGCVWSNFATGVTTDKGSYSAGQPVQITLEFANAGPACTVNATGYGCPRVNITNAAGTLVWTNAAPVSTGCPTTFTGPTVIAANWTQSFAIPWGQDSCTPGQAQGCPGPPVPAGQYQLVGTDGGGTSQIPAGTPVTISLTASS
jgi:hypothetical protein